ncbi:hypothetical protein DFP72DRAFT_1092094 [Ephemerocybe angulata]|uniref:Fungal-type protein kinase domain-containing protein n=1 Tax=Ephemerocybe angulata TaxID=980116 RepID=A0A8H6IAG2_9AGAR|nr:hypothetical protein DFP72DRAFT_1092094 [Tulosesus angulatus]
MPAHSPSEPEPARSSGTQNATAQPSGGATHDNGPEKSILRQSQALFEDMKDSTPMKSDSNGLNSTIRDQKEVIMAELNHIPKISADFLEEAYKDKVKVTDAEIDIFFKVSKLYKRKRWSAIPNINKNAGTIYLKSLHSLAQSNVAEKQCDRRGLEEPPKLGTVPASRERACQMVDVVDSRWAGSFFVGKRFRTAIYARRGRLFVEGYDLHWARSLSCRRGLDVGWAGWFELRSGSVTALRLSVCEDRLPRGFLFVYAITAGFTNRFSIGRAGRRWFSVGSAGKVVFQGVCACRCYQVQECGLTDADLLYGRAVIVPPMYGTCLVLIHVACTEYMVTAFSLMKVIDLEDELYTPLVDIINGIIGHLGKPDEGDVSATRTAIDTHKAWYIHHDNKDNMTRPDLAILSTGPSFEEPLPKKRTKREPGHWNVGYSNVASVFDVKRDCDNYTDEQIKQLAVYIRQIYISQPNRRHCRSLIITETLVRLLHYDRSGAFVTWFINFHDDPYTFVRLILGLSSYNEETLGLDTSVQWIISSTTGRKISGTITVRDSRTGNPLPFELNMLEPPTMHHAIRGTGTTYWNAFELPGGRGRLIIKDSWREDGRVGEKVFLRKARKAKVKGVVEMVEFQDNIANTRSYRPRDLSILDAPDFFNRKLSRLVVRSPGPSLAYFKSQAQAIRALRDAVKVHSNLLIAGILHRNISLDNILLVEEGNSAEDDVSGVLFDLSMAVLATGEKTKLSPESRTVASRIFVSCAMLDCRAKSLARIAQDYLDDLESFQYVLVRLLHGFTGVNQPVIKHAPDSPLTKWATRDGAKDNKLMYLKFGPSELSHTIPLFWSPPCIDLCRKIGQLLHNVASEKIFTRQNTSIDPEQQMLRKQALSAIYDGIDSHYGNFIRFCDEAIEELSKPGGDRPREPLLLPAPSSALDNRFYNVDRSTASPGSQSSASEYSPVRRLGVEPDQQPAADDSRDLQEDNTVTPRPVRAQKIGIFPISTPPDFVETPSGKVKGKRTLADANEDDEPTPKRNRLTFDDNIGASTSTNISLFRVEDGARGSEGASSSETPNLVANDGDVDEIFAFFNEATIIEVQALVDP